MHSLADLNPAQRDAVTAPVEHMLVLAGAGSGKTRVLVHRMIYLAREHGIPLHKMLAVTFTNKAAKEIRNRVENILALSSQGLWLGTFHSIAHRLLRVHHTEAGLPQDFQVLDSDDQLRLIKRILKDQNLDDRNYAPEKVQHFINHQKEQGYRAKDLHFKERDIHHQIMRELYAAYENACINNGVVDFSELLLRTFELLRDHPQIRMHYQERFVYVLVDEFQDTNTIQYAWLKQLIGTNNRLMVVGDDDQSIYGWRGAKIENIHRVQKDFPGLLIRLEQNYRSTKTILNAANAVIANNESRLGKELWSEGDEGHAISLYAAFNEIDEARFVASEIESLLRQGFRPHEIAILYRTNMQSRVLEEALLQNKLPYKIYGGLRFFDRAEIKNALAYARIVLNINDDIAFERIINFPARGVGEKTLEQIREHAKTTNRSLFKSMQVLLEQKAFSNRADMALRQFENLVISLQETTKTLQPAVQFEKILTASNLTLYYQAEPDEKSQGRVENLQELLTAVEEFYLSREQFIENGSLSEFLAHASLESSADQATVGDAVQMMTLHSAKGLEFPVVFMVGMEDQIFPARAADEDPTRLEEERRLCYVGMTRAMQKLYLSFAEQRRFFRETTPQTPSRFLDEIPAHCLDPFRSRSANFRFTRPTEAYKGWLGAGPHKHAQLYEHAGSAKRQDSEALKWQLGQSVSHAKFGEGVVLDVEGTGEQTRLRIKFRDVGIKWIVAEFVKRT